MPANTRQNFKGKRKRWNKNQKKNWSKVDVSDIEKGLEIERLQQRTGGVVKDQKDSELFTIEKTPGKTTPKTTLERARSKVLRVDKVLGEPVIEKKTRVVKKPVKRLGKKKKDTAVVAAQTKPKEAGPSMDLWGVSAEEVADKLFKVNKFEKHTKKVIGQNKMTKFIPPKAICTTAVEVAHAGASYNPTVDDHQNLLAVEHERELKRLAKEEKIARAIHVDPKDYVTEEIRQQELTEGLFADESDDEEEEEEKEVVDEVHSTVTVPKSRQKRRREQAAKDAIREKEEQKAKRIRENEVFRTKTLLNEIKTEKFVSKVRQEKKKEIAATKQPQLSYMKFEKPDQDLQLSDEIAGSLRKLKPEGNVMVDRYQSFQQRCVIEPRKKFKNTKRDTKVKYQEKRDYRAITL